MHGFGRFKNTTPVFAKEIGKKRGEKTAYKSCGESRMISRSILIKIRHKPC